MEFLGVLLIAALVFLVCFLIDKGFARLFRSQMEHRSGLAVRLNKKYGVFGLILAVLGVAAALVVWCTKKDVRPEECAFYDPQNSCWFPPVEEI